MLLLTSTSDLLTLITGSALNTDVHISWMDYQSATGAELVTPGRTNTLITTAATTTILAAPGDATTFRSVKQITIRNRGVAANSITVKHTDGSHNVELINVVLSPGDSLLYTDHAGWFVINAVGAFVSAGSPTLLAAKIDFSASGNTTIVAGVATQIVKVYRLLLVVAAATNIAFKDGASTALSGAMALVAAGASITCTAEAVPHFSTAAGNGFVINSSNAVQVSGVVWYTQA